MCEKDPTIVSKPEVPASRHRGSNWVLILSSWLLMFEVGDPGLESLEILLLLPLESVTYEEFSTDESDWADGGASSKSEMPVRTTLGHGSLILTCFPSEGGLFPKQPVLT